MMATLPKNITVHVTHSTFSLTIDGEEFPFYLAEAGVEVLPPRGDDGLPAVRLTVLADQVTMDWDLRAETSARAALQADGSYALKPA